MKKIAIILIGFFLASIHTIMGQDGSAGIIVDETMHDFGYIVESDGSVSHAFVITNTGDAPLVITRVTSSCGCSTPEWSKQPIEPGKTSEVTVTYNPKGRPGPFLKKISIFSNGKKGPLSMNIRGHVVTKPVTPPISYAYSIGDLKLDTKTIAFNNIRPDETLEQKVHIKNESSSPVIIKPGKTSNYLVSDIRPDTLQPGDKGEILLALNAQTAKRMGRIITELPVTIETEEKKGVQGSIAITANVIDNFSNLSSTDKANAPVADISSTLLDFGLVEEKGSFIPGLGGKTTENITITNTGKSNLSVYSITSDNELIDISGGRKDIKPGASATYKISIRPKEIKTKLEGLVHIVCNDPNGPVRLIKVTAEK